MDSSDSDDEWECADAVEQRVLWSVHMAAAEHARLKSAARSVRYQLDEAVRLATAARLDTSTAVRSELSNDPKVRRLREDLHALRNRATAAIEWVPPLLLKCASARQWLLLPFDIDAAVL